MATENNKKWASAVKCLGKKGKLSVIMPVYALAPVVQKNIYTVFNLLKDKIAFEIIPVDDGSCDGTDQVLQQIAVELGSVVRPVCLSMNAGKGNALKSGFAVATGTYILLLDGDLDLTPAKLPTFFDIMLREDAAIVIGSKRHPDSHIDYPWHRRLASSIYYSMVWLLVGLPVSDTQTGMKLFKREALKWALDRMLVKTFAFDLELLSIAYAQGFKVAEAPIEMHFGDKMGCLTWHNIKQVMQDTLAIFYRLKILRYYQSVEVVKNPKTNHLVSIVIACPAYSNYLKECLSGIARQSYKNLEVIVLPDTPFVPEEYPFPLQIIATGKSRPAAKRNAGIAAARGSIIAFIDDDAYPAPDWLKHAIPYFSLPDTGAVGGPGVTPPDDPFMAQAGGRVYANLLVSGNYRYRYAGDRVRTDIDDLPSCNLMVKREILVQINGYRTDFWPGEDTLLCLSITKELKKRIIYDPWVLVFHHRRPLFGAHLRQTGRYALHRGHFLKRFPATSFRIGYMIPTLFVVALIVGGLIAPLHPLLLYIYIVGVALYLLLTLISSFSINPLMWLTVWTGVIATHLVYGVRFAQGVLSRLMPCEVERFDHPSEQQPDSIPTTIVPEE